MIEKNIIDTNTDIEEPKYYDSFGNIFLFSLISCFLFPWYIYTSFCLIFNKPVPRKTINNLLKAYAFFPYYVLKIYKTLLLRYKYRIEGNKKLIRKIFSAGKEDFYNGVVSIIIPVYNGGDDLKNLIQRLKVQEKIFKLEIIVIDSGSIDGSVEFIKGEEVKLIEIPKTEFSHSGTRNLGAKEACGDILLFMTQDAFPPDLDWVFKIITPINEYGAAAVGCVEKPKADCSIFTGTENKDYRNSYNFGDCIVHLKKGKNLGSWWEMNTRVSDVSLAVRNEVFKKFLYEGDFAEDKNLCVKLLKKNYTIAILTSIQIIHSHERTALYEFKRSYISTKSLKDILPNFKSRKLSLHKIVNSAIYTYSNLSILFNYMESLEEDYEPGDFIELCACFWGNIKNSKSQQLILGMWYSCAELDEIFLFFENFHTNCRFNDTIYINSLMDYFNFSIQDYLLGKYNVINKIFKKQIIDAIFKKWLILLANDLAYYFCRRPGISTPLFLKLEELSKGI